MIIRKAFKFKLKVNSSDQAKKLAQFAGSCRYVWNIALALIIAKLDRKHAIPWYQELAYWLTFWKKTEERSFLKDCPSQALQQTLKNLDKAVKDAFDKKQPNKKFPRFKKKGKNDAFRYPQGFKIEGNRVFLPKIGWIGFRKSQDIIGKVKNITVARKNSGWYISIQTEIEVTEPVHSSSSMVGIDLGIAKFATLSNGIVYSPVNSFKKHQKRLAKLQKMLAKKVKFSNNWQKLKAKISRLHEKIANCRKDYLHKVSTQISENQAMIIMENLKVSNMSKSAKGTIENPGKKVSQKTGLNRSILDQGWSMFVDMLKYKQRWAGGDVVLIDPKNTSRKCSDCGHTSADNRQSQSDFACVECGLKLNADFNASINILRAGHARLACGDFELSESMKQELLAAVA